MAYFLDFTPQFNGVARVGAINNTGKLSISGGLGSGSFSEDSIQAYFGFGVAYNVTPNFAVTAEADFSRLKYGADGVTDTSNSAAVHLRSALQLLTRNGTARATPAMFDEGAVFASWAVCTHIGLNASAASTPRLTGRCIEHGQGREG